jgi:hypothetical protein
MIRTWQDAEYTSRDIMRSLGYTDARVTGEGSDGGVDVVSRRAFAQVKCEMSKTGSPALQRLVGAGAVDRGRDLLFFSVAGYSTPAIHYANRVGVALFQLRTDGSAVPVNKAARTAAEGHDLTPAGTQTTIVPSVPVAPAPQQPVTVTSTATTMSKSTSSGGATTGLWFFTIPALMAIAGWKAGLDGAFWPTNIDGLGLFISVVLGWGFTLIATVVAILFGAVLVSILTEKPRRQNQG